MNVPCSEVCCWNCMNASCDQSCNIVNKENIGKKKACTIEDDYTENCFCGMPDSTNDD